VFEAKDFTTLKGLSHAMDLASDDIRIWLVLGLNGGGAIFFNFFR
jgi:hypothetical protein